MWAKQYTPESEKRFRLKAISSFITKEICSNLRFAIIAILAAILLPALKNVREIALRAGCISNLRQIYIGCLNYVGDFDNVMPIGPARALNWPSVYCCNTGWSIMRDTGYIKWDLLKCPSMDDWSYSTSYGHPFIDYEYRYNIFTGYSWEKMEKKNVFANKGKSSKPLFAEAAARRINKLTGRPFHRSFRNEQNQGDWACRKWAHSRGGHMTMFDGSTQWLPNGPWIHNSWGAGWPSEYGSVGVFRSYYDHYITTIP